jgi:uncharacterized protein YccT (UPF0319 family)
LTCWCWTEKVSSLLRGADSIELDNGRHQLVFRVEKTIRLANHEERLYISPPLVISFDTQLVSQVNFHLPRLRTSEMQRILMMPPRRTAGWGFHAYTGSWIFCQSHPPQKS